MENSQFSKNLRVQVGGDNAADNQTQAWRFSIDSQAVGLLLLLPRLSGTHAGAFLI